MSQVPAWRSEEHENFKFKLDFQVVTKICQDRRLGSLLVHFVTITYLSTRFVDLCLLVLDPQMLVDLLGDATFKGEI
jgi:hypothetical protein